MWRFITIFFTTALAALSGCGVIGPSLDPFYTAPTVEANDQLVGVWKRAGEAPAADAATGKDFRVIVSPLERGHYRVELESSEKDTKSAVVLLGTLFRVGTNTYLNITLSDETRRALNKQYFGLVLFPHYVVKLDIAPDRVQIYSQDHKRLVRMPGDPAPASEFQFRELADQKNKPADERSGLFIKSVIVGTPTELQRSLTLAEANGLFVTSVALERVKPEIK